MDVDKKPTFYFSVIASQRVPQIPKGKSSQVTSPQSPYSLVLSSWSFSSLFFCFGLLFLHATIIQLHQSYTYFHFFILTFSRCILNLPVVKVFNSYIHIFLKINKVKIYVFKMYNSQIHVIITCFKDKCKFNENYSAESKRKLYLYQEK